MWSELLTAAAPQVHHGPMRLGLAALLLPALVACGGADEDREPKAAPTTEATTTNALGSLLEDPAAAKPVTPDPGPFPDGYPRKVPVASVPSPIDSHFEGQRFAVAVAPGVWTELAPGVSVREAGGHGSLAGHCASVAKYEREYDDSRGSTCW